MHFGCGTLQVVPFDFPKLTENTPAQLGSNAFECLQAERCKFGRKKFQKFNYLDSYTSCAKSNPLRTLKQIKGVHNLLCAYHAGREVFEQEGSEESCLASTTLKITSRMSKRVRLRCA
jgi:hypothetical protein